MTTEQPEGRLSNIDKFGLGTGLIGLVADAVSLAGLFTFSSSAQGTPTHIWILVLLSLIYSIAATNFYVRRYFCKRVPRKGEKLSSQELNRVEEGTASVTSLISFPILIAYFTSAFIARSSFYSSLSFFPSYHLWIIPWWNGSLFYSWLQSSSC